MRERVMLLNATAIQRVLTRMAHEIAEKNEDSRSVALVGVQRGGVHLARRLAGILNGIWGHSVPVGALDVSMHRDDLDTHLVPNVHPTEIPFDLREKNVVLVDDVLFSGRTTRAALDALNEFRPSTAHPVGRPDRSRSSPIANQSRFCWQKRPDSSQ